MSAVATADVVSVDDAPAVHAVTVAGRTVQQMHDAEQRRWMIWFGLPALVASFFVAMTFATGHAWWLGLAIAAIVVDILVMVWLAMSSDTNGTIDESPAPAH